MHAVVFTEGFGTGRTFVREFTDAMDADHYADVHQCMVIEERDLVASRDYYVSLRREYEDKLRGVNTKLRQIGEALDKLEAAKPE